SGRSPAATRRIRPLALALDAPPAAVRLDRSAARPPPQRTPRFRPCSSLDLCGEGWVHSSMHTSQSSHLDSRRAHSDAPIPIVALDVRGAAEALDLVARLPDADFFKVGLQLYTAEGPEIVRRLRGLGKRVFLDLKLHDIPNTVAGAVRSAARLGVEILTVHAVGGTAMLSAAADAARSEASPPRLFAVTVLTSLSSADLAAAWG